MRMLSPLERLAAVEEVARVVRFVVTEGRWINGQTLRVNGGVA
jgi:3-oxoacyl-[acyl-carrier protein] reductase